MNRLTATLITFNEERNLPRALASLEDLPDEIVVVDSGSTDRSCEIARQVGARVFAHPWINFAEQRNFAAAQAAHDWILALDADEELSPELRTSLRAWKARPPEAVAYEFSRKARYLGSWVRHSGWYPDRKTRLYHRCHACFRGVTHDSLRAEGRVARLKGDLYHHAFSNLSQHVAKVNAYSSIAAQEMFAAGRRQWRAGMLLAPPWTIIERLVLKGGFLDGYRGAVIAWMAARYVFLKYRKLGVLARGGSLASGTARAAGESAR